MVTYEYQKQINSDQLTDEIQEAGLGINLQRIDTVENNVKIVFLNDLTIEQKSTLDDTVNSHIPMINHINSEEVDLINQINSYIIDPNTANMAGLVILTVLLPMFPKEKLEQILSIIQSQIQQ